MGEGQDRGLVPKSPSMEAPRQKGLFKSNVAEKSYLGKRQALALARSFERTPPRDQRADGGQQESRAVRAGGGSE